VRLEDFRAHLDGGLEGVHDVVHRAVQQDFDEDQQAGAELQWVQSRLVTEDVALAREPLDTVEHRGGRQVHFFSELQIADAAVGLQYAQDATVDLVQSSVGARLHGAGFSAIAWLFRIRCGHARHKLRNRTICPCDS
jgi:hypothetical protein